MYTTTMQKKAISLIMLCFSLCWALMLSNSLAAQAETQVEDVVISEPIGHIAVASQAVAVHGDYAYVGFDTFFTVVDISDPTLPIEVGQVDLAQRIEEIVVRGTLAYVAVRDGVEAVDISKPTLPTFVERYDLTVVAEMILHGNYLYVLSLYEGLTIFEVDNSASFSPIGVYERRIYSPAAMDIHYPYIFLGGGLPDALLQIIDVSNPVLPIEVIGYERFRPSDLAVNGDRLVTIGGGCSSTCATYTSVLEWKKDEWSLNFLGSDTRGTSSSSSRAVNIDDAYAYVAKDIGFYIFNIYFEDQQGTVPKLVTFINVLDIEDIFINEEFVFTAGEEGFHILPKQTVWKKHLPIIFNH